MKILDVVQGSEDWLAARAGIVTASELDNLISPTLKIREGETPKTYLYTKIAEKWRGFPEQSFSGGAMEQGSMLEDEALPWYSVRHKVSIRRVGLVLADGTPFGASPDGLIEGQECGLEVKCPRPSTHVKWLMAGIVPPEHLLQCYGGMYATGYGRWVFVSYCRDFPALVVGIDGIPGELEVLMKQTIGQFNVRLAEGIKKLEEANGGAKHGEDETDSVPF